MGSTTISMQGSVRQENSMISLDSSLGGTSLDETSAAMLPADQEYVNDKESLDPEGCGTKKIRSSLMAKNAYDRWDPLCTEIVKSKAQYDELRARLVLTIRENIGDNRTSKSQELIDGARAAALEEYDKLMALIHKKEREDALKDSFDVGKPFIAIVVSASNLPKMDRFGAVDAYCTLDYQLTRRNTEPPEQDGVKTSCMECEKDNDAGRANCQMHRSQVAQKSFSPVWNRSYKLKLDDSKNSLLIGVYSWNRSGAHPMVGYLRIPIWTVLYTKEVTREYLLLNTVGQPVKAMGTNPDGSTDETFAKLKITWRYVYTAPSTKTIFAPPGTAEKHLNGWHIRRWEGGSGYVGTWIQGLPHGFGVYYGANGAVYEGNWFKAKMSGDGKYTFPNGDRYEGQWKDGKRHGQGVCVAVCGDVYDGVWRWGFQHGWGTHTSVDGETYEGEWKDGRAHGIGAITRADGRKFDGIWYEGKLVSRGHSRPPTPEGYKGERRDRVEELPVPDLLQDHNLSALIRRAAKNLHNSLPYEHRTGPATVRPYKGDALMHDEDIDAAPKGFWDRNKEGLETFADFRIVIEREEIDISEKMDAKKKRFRHAAASKKPEKVKSGFDPDSLGYDRPKDTESPGRKGFLSRIWSLMKSPGKKKGNGMKSPDSAASPASPSSPAGSPVKALKGAVMSPAKSGSGVIPPHSVTK